MDFLRRLFTTKEPENRGTVTLLPDGTYLLGVPHGTDAETAFHASRGLADWLESDRKALVFPFPVDVIDLRSRSDSPLLLGGAYGLRSPLERIAQVLDRIDRKTVKRRPRVIMCQHPELHPDEQIG